MIKAGGKREIFRTSNTLAFRLLKRAIYNLLCPMDYTRTREIPVLVGLIEQYFAASNATVLDIASPQVLSCHLASVAPSWSITYLNSLPDEIIDMELKKSLLGLQNIATSNQDVRNPDSLKPEYFDMAVSCSVFEHIVDLDGGYGDSIAVQNVAASLKPGGLLFFSVPFSKRAFEEFRPRPQYKDVHGKKGKYFFQRFYDEQTLNERLIVPSGLSFEHLCYTGERYYNKDNVERRTTMLFSSSFVKQILMGRLYPWITRIFFVEADDYSKLLKPYLAYGVLRKC